MSKREKSYNDKLHQVQEIYERLSQEYHAIPENERYQFHFKSRLLVSVQTQMHVSERKAQEWLRLVDRLMDLKVS